ncbi:putative lipoprotein, partial [Yersinia pestis PY-03]
MNWNCT